MALEIEAVYENGVLRPLQQLDLSEHEHVTISIGVPEPLKAPYLDVEYIEYCKKQLEGVEVPNIEDVRRSLSKIPGSMADLIIEQRGER